MSGSLTDLRAAFEPHFASWVISLPKEALRTRRTSVICQAGWTIYYALDLKMAANTSILRRYRENNDRFYKVTQAIQSQVSDDSLK